MNLRDRFAIGTFVVLIFVVSSANAEEVTFKFSGPVFRVDNDSSLDPGFGIGDQFEVTVTFESATPDSQSADPAFGVYPLAITDLSVQVGGYSASSAVGEINTANTTFDNYSAFTDNISGADVLGMAPVFCRVSLFDDSGTAFSSDALPLTPPNPANFTNKILELFFSNPLGKVLRVVARIESATTGNQSPTADAGSDQSIRAGDTVVLDGSASFDDDTLPESLLYFWSFVSKPAGSNAALDDPTAAMPSFLADLNGTYSVQLVVADEANAVSDPALVTISSDNLAPVAVADSLFTLAIVGEPFLLDGTASSDPENDPIAYDWILVSVPTGSLTTLVDASTSMPSFTPDVEGDYLVLLQVSDFIGPGEPVLLEITATSNQEFAEVVIVDAADQVDFLDDTQVTTQGNQEAFGNLLSGATKNIQKGNESQAIDKLLKAIERVDGCALRGAPDGNGPGMDWVTDCDEQLAIYDSLIAALNALSP